MLILDDEQRKLKRRIAQMMATVEGHIDRVSKWTEAAPIVDYSALGAAFTLTRRAKKGSLVRLIMPMPREMRGFDFAKEDYEVWGVVRRCVPVEIQGAGTKYSIGVAFIGKTAPREFFEYPSRPYELAGDAPVNGFWKLKEPCCSDPMPVKATKPRKHKRYEIPEEVVLELLDPNGGTVASETTVTLNISQKGAAAYSELPATIGSTVRVICPNTNIRLISLVRGIDRCRTGLRRMHIEFIDQPFPINVY